MEKEKAVRQFCTRAGEAHASAGAAVTAQSSPRTARSKTTWVGSKLMRRCPMAVMASVIHWWHSHLVQMKELMTRARRPESAIT